jgi:acetyltransferase-like isoleucine patch superfamily enzyme
MKLQYYIAKLIKFLHLPAIKNSSIHKTSRVASASHVVNTTMGKYSYIGNSCTVVDVTIGNFCSIADNVIIGGASHPMEWVSTSPVFCDGKNIMNKNFSTHNFQTTVQTNIGNDVWIGNNCLIKSGVTVDNGAVIGMGSVVTKDIGPYEVWGGTPAKIIRKRFDSDIIEKLLNSKWWNWDDKKIMQNSKHMNDIIRFFN